MAEREINLIDLFVEILLHWRMFIILMLAGSVLLGGYSYIRSNKEVKNLKAQREALESQPESLFSEEEIKNASHAAACGKIYQDAETYFEKSQLMSLDPNHICKSEATIAVLAEDHQKSCDIEKVYEDIVQSGELSQYIADNMDITSSNTNELIFKVPGNVALNAAIASLEDTNTLRIATIYSDEINCKKMMELIITFLNDKQSSIEDTMGEHEISVVNTSYGIVSDPDIAEAQRTALAKVTTSKKEFSTAKDSLSDAELQYYALLTNNYESETAVAESGELTASPHVSVKYILVGAIITAFLYACVLLFIYIFNSKIRIIDSFQELYEIPQLGVIPADKKSKKLFNFVDEWILSIRNHNKRQFTSDEALELASVAIKISAGKEMLDEICLIGCGLKGQTLDVCEKLKAQLATDGLRVNILDNVLYNAQTMNDLENVKSVVLVEGAGSTLYNEIAGELELMKRQGIKALGGILVE